MADNPKTKTIEVEDEPKRKHRRGVDENEGPVDPTPPVDPGDEDGGTPGPPKQR